MLHDLYLHEKELSLVGDMDLTSLIIYGAGLGHGLREERKIVILVHSQWFDRA